MPGKQALGIQIPSKKVVWGVFRRFSIPSQKVCGSIGKDRSMDFSSVFPLSSSFTVSGATSGCDVGGFQKGQRWMSRPARAGVYSLTGGIGPLAVGLNFLWFSGKSLLNQKGL